MKLNVREFRFEDAEAFLGMGRFLVETSFFKQVGINLKKVLDLFNMVMTNDAYFGRVIETENGQPVGSFVAHVTPYFFADAKIASELCFGIFPPFRADAENAMGIILSEYLEWAKAQGAIEAQIAPATGTVGNKLDTYLTTAGFEPVGKTYKRWIA